MFNQPTFDVAVQEHEVGIDTAIVSPWTSSSPTVIELGLIELVHAGGAPDWLTVNVAPPTVTVPTRGDDAEFAATLRPTDPLPTPLAFVTVIQGA